MEEKSTKHDSSGDDVRKNLPSEFDQLVEFLHGPGTTDPPANMAPPQVVPVSVQAPVLLPAPPSTDAVPGHVLFPATAPTAVVHHQPLQGGRISSSIISSTFCPTALCWWLCWMRGTRYIRLV